MRLRVLSGLASAALALTTTVFSLMLAEIAFRTLDGYHIWSWSLVHLRPASPPPTSVVAKHLDSIALANGMKKEWFAESPTSLPRSTVSTALLESSRRYHQAGIPSEAVHVFNWAFVKDRICKDVFFSKIPGFIFAFDAPNERPYPRYRFPRNVTTPAGMVTNQFGWRGPQLDLHKPPQTIRIAFVGASTTVNDHSFPFSYPELAVFWLNKWAKEQGLNKHIEVVNAGREGMSSTDISAIARDEVLPIEPDIIVYYEGSNQINPSSIVALREGTSLSPVVATDVRWVRAAYFLGTQSYSAFARRLGKLLATEVA